MTLGRPWSKTTIHASLLPCSWSNGRSGITHEAVCVYDQLSLTSFTFTLNPLYGIKKAKAQKTSGISQSALKPILVVTGIYPSHTHTRAAKGSHQNNLQFWSVGENANVRKSTPTPEIWNLCFFLFLPSHLFDSIQR